MLTTRRWRPKGCRGPGTDPLLLSAAIFCTATSWSPSFFREIGVQKRILVNFENGRPILTSSRVKVFQSWFISGRETPVGMRLSHMMYAISVALVLFSQRRSHLFEEVTPISSRTTLRSPGFAGSRISPSIWAVYFHWWPLYSPASPGDKTRSAK